MSQTLYMLDTNIVSHIIKANDPRILTRLASLPISNVAISSVTEAELQYGLSKCGRPPGLTARIREFLARVDVLPWDSKAAAVYGDLRTSCEAVGISLADMDMLIATHAISVAAILVTRDKAFSYIKNQLVLEDWM